MKTARICWRTWKGAEIIHDVSPPLSLYCKQKPNSILYNKMWCICLFQTGHTHWQARKCKD